MTYEKLTQLIGEASMLNEGCRIFDDKKAMQIVVEICKIIEAENKKQSPTDVWAELESEKQLESVFLNGCKSCNTRDGIEHKNTGYCISCFVEKLENKLKKL